MRTFFYSTVIATFMGLSGCSGSPAQLECVDNGDCNGTSEACLENSCVEVDCLSSASCELQQFCDETYTCASGCSEDTDCLAGEDCVDGTCEAYGCRNTQLDCEFGEICNENTGNCQPASGLHCDTCDYWSTFGICSGSAACVPFDEFASESYCLETCNPNASNQCPRGFECLDIYGDGSNYCFAWCPTLYANGWM